MCRLPERKSRPDRGQWAADVAVVVVVAVVAMASLGACWAGMTQTFARPTPTPSATPGARPTETPDFRATNTIQDLRTQEAYSTQIALIAPEETATEDPTLADEGDQPGDESPEEGGATPWPDLTATAVSILLPVIELPDLATATALAEQGIVDAGAGGQPAPVETPTLVPEATTLPIDGAEATPMETPTPTLLPQEAPTATFVPPPTLAPPAPTNTPVPLPAYLVGTLSAVTDRRYGSPALSALTPRVGPSSIYTATAAIPFGANITLQARDTTGEWLYFCCLPNSSTPAWIRAANVSPINNPTPPPPFSGLNPNDTRWLQVRPAEPGLAPLPVNTPAPVADFPMARVDRANTGRVAQLPQLPLQIGWDPSGSAGLAGGAFTSGIMVFNANVVAASTDGHVYSFDRESGGQRWRYFVGETVTATPLALNGIIYVLTQAGEMIPLTEQGAENSDSVWGFNLTPHGSPVSSFGRILFTARSGDVDRLYAVDPTFGAIVQNVTITGTNVSAPSLGGQLVYVTGDRLRAHDFFNGEMVWQSTWSGTFTAPPLYASPGVDAAAEIYVVDAGGILTAFDANTGSILWQAQVGGVADGLAANATTIVATGNGFVRAFARTRRNEGQLLWQAGINGRVIGGALIDDTRVFVATDGGAFQYFDVSTGALIQGNVAAPQIGAAVAVSGPWIFVPTVNGVVYSARQVPQ